MSYSIRTIMSSPLLITTIALIVFTSSLPSSLGDHDHDHDHHHHHHHHRDRDHKDRDNSDKEKDLRDLCSDVSDSRQCWEIIKSVYDRFDTDDAGVVGAAIDLARGKASDFHDLCNQLHDDSNDDKLKDKYEKCSRNYDDATRDLDDAKSSLDSNDYQNITEKIDNVVDELNKCRDEFGDGAFDPAHVGDRNNEFGVYADIVKVAADRLVDRS